MDKTFTGADMIEYLQAMLTRFQSDMNKYGKDDRIVEKEFDDMIACKEMVEDLVGEPINLQKDGKVTVGF